MKLDTYPRSRTSRLKPALLISVLLLSLLLMVHRQRTAASPDSSSQNDQVFFPLTVGPPGFSITPVGSGFVSVTDVTHAGDDRLFIAELAGRVQILHPDGRITTFLDIRNQVISNRGEYGFFDITFHPGYKDPASPGYGLFYVSYTSGFDDGTTLDVDFNIVRYQVSADPDHANPASATLIFRVAQGFDVHKGGGMEFDPRNDMLYVGLGDDRLLLIAQDIKSPKGKVFRLDVNKVPRDKLGDARSYVSDEVWALGLRNPWRIDIDLPTNTIFVGEVGDQLWEEVNIIPLSAQGFNYGWPCLEGPVIIPEANDIPQCKNPAGFVRAIHEYAHRDGSGRCAVIGGKVIRPPENPNRLSYVMADMCTREIFMLKPVGSSWQRSLLGILNGDLIASIGEDVRGNQYVGTVAPSAPIYRLNIPSYLTLNP